SMHAIFDQQGNVIYLVPEGRDVTDRKKQEELLRRSQKMDALGKLTGGIAHDYNNMLCIIRGYTELLSENLVADPKLLKYVNDIQHAADRGIKLTRKLLAFTHQIIPEVTTCDINILLNELHLMLEKTLTVKVNLLYELAENLWPVNLDKNDLEDCIINICINAVHSMAIGGRLTIRTTNEHLDTKAAAHVNLAPGDYVALSIADTGCGMDDKTLEKIFDPFFTTKKDKGTGLGMSQVFGFVQSTSGNIKIYSEPGHGTRVVLYFPRSHELVKKTRDTEHRSSGLRGSESVLVVDDEVAITEFAYEILMAHGYSVLTANSAEKALEILKRESIDLVITDVIMPDIDGYELSSIIRKKYPQVKIQIVSGFEDDRHKNKEGHKLRANIVYKPYTAYKLLACARNLLEVNGIADPLIGRIIMIMDDEMYTRELFKISVEKMGCQSITARNDSEAIDCFRQAIDSGNPVDIVVLDIAIPGSKGGVEVADKIRELKPDAIIIVSSGDTECEEMKHFHRFGFNGALDKASDFVAMEKLFRKLLI
ncbi:MAG: response regulator, partial [Desulfobacteraceae bacterium]|nr:response regulator [Desulfobacteraceae bacterium]